MDVSKQLRDTWPQLGRRPSARVSARSFISRYPFLNLDNAADLCDVTSALDLKSGRSQESKAQILSALLRDASDPELRQALTVALIPGFHNEAAKLQRALKLDPGASLVSSMITAGDEIIDRWAGQDRPYAGPDILSAARSSVRREVLKDDRRRVLEHQVVEHVGWGWEDGMFAAQEIPADFYRSELERFRGTNHERAARLTIAAVYEGRGWEDVGRMEDLSARGAQREARVFVVETGLLRLT